MGNTTRVNAGAVPGFVMLCLTGLIHGCASQTAEKPVEHTVRKVTPETQSDIVKTAAAMKEEFERGLRENLERLDGEVQEIQKRFGKLKESAQAEWAEEMAELDDKRTSAAARLEEVRKSAVEAWEHLRAGATRAREELEQAVQKARKEF